MSSQERWSQLTAALLEMRQNVLTLEQRIDRLEKRTGATVEVTEADGTVEIIHVQS